MLSPFQLRKLIMGYYRWDTTKDGLVCASDFEELGRRVASNLNVDPASEAHSRIVAGYQGVWDAYWKALDTDGDNAVTLQEVIDAFTMAVAAMNTAENAEFAKQTNMQLVSALDVNGNGEIRLEEYTAFVCTLGASQEDAVMAFNKLDRNGNGALGANEIAVAWAEYYASDDLSSPSNWFYGEF